MKNNPLFLMTAVLFLGLLSSCISEDESVEAIHQEDLKKIQAYIDNADIQASKQTEVGNTGIVLLFTKENLTGAVPQVGDTLRVNYTGYFLNEQVFDTSVEQIARHNNLYSSSRDYIPFRVLFGYPDIVIDGWQYALAQMKEGESATALIPSRFAYGRYGRGNIQPNTVLAFDLELVEVIKARSGSN